MGFWKKNDKTTMRSDEFEELTRKLVQVVGDVDIVSNRVELLASSFRKISARLSVMKREAKDEEAEKTLNNDKLFI
jgi:hypothetical protein